MKKLTTSILIVSSLALCGCHALRKDDGIERDWLGREIEVEYTSPSKIVAIWTNSVFNEPGKRPMRGLGGRVYFYDGQHHPIPVNGKLSVFVYDDSNPDERLKQEATRVVHFSPEQVRSNFTPSEFGASYSFWVPWDTVGGDRKQLSVIPVFTDMSGQMLVGDQARHLLPGSKPIEFDEQQADIVQASHEQASPSTSKLAHASGEPKSLPVLGSSATIKLPATTQARLKSMPPKKQRNTARFSRSPWTKSLTATQLDDEPLVADLQARSSGAVDANTDPEPTSSGEKDFTGRPPVHSQPSRHQAPSSPFAQRLRDHVRKQLDPGASPFAR